MKHGHTESGHDYEHSHSGGVAAHHHRGPGAWVEPSRSRWQRHSGDLHRSDSGVCWYTWVGQDTVEIREIRREPYEYLGLDGEWHQLGRYETFPPSHVLDARGAASIGVPPLEPGVHVFEPNYDRCLRCKMTGWQLHKNGPRAGVDCPGWDN